MLRRIERRGRHKDLHAEFIRRATFAQDGLVAVAPHDSSVELAEDFAEVDRRVLDDPIEFTPWTGDEAVEAAGYAVDKLAHRYQEYSGARTYFLSSMANTWPSTVLSVVSAYCTRAFIPLKSEHGFMESLG